MLQLYKITPNKLKSEDLNFKTQYLSVIVVAENADEAKFIHPNGKLKYDIVSDVWRSASGAPVVDVDDPNSHWVAPDDMVVEHLGIAASHLTRGVILSDLYVC